MGATKGVFACRSEALAEVRTFVRGFLHAEGVENSQAELLVLGVNEAYANVIRHAEAAGEPVEVLCERDGAVLRFRLRDYGLNPVAPSRFPRRPLESVEPGGLGLYFIEHVFDRAVYVPQEQGTVLELTKSGAFPNTNFHQ